MKTFFYSAVIAGTMALTPLTTANAATVVDVELSLLIDVSGSVDSTEFNLQRQGYVDAFLNPVIQNLILDKDSGNRLGKIAVNAIYWSGASQQIQAVGWTLIDSAQASIDFANTLFGTSRTYSGLTAPGNAINFAVNSINTNDFDGKAKVIDVSGDGSQNDGVSTATARTNAITTGGIDRINGIAILGSEGGLQTWYENNIKGGTDSFVIAASGFDTFGAAIEQKLAYEITGTNPNVVPLPAAAWLLGAGIAGFGVIRRRQKRA